MRLQVADLPTLGRAVELHRARRGRGPTGTGGQRAVFPKSPGPTRPGLGIGSPMATSVYEIAEATIHHWDLRRALGQDEQLDDEPVEQAWAVIEPAIAFPSRPAYPEPGGTETVATSTLASCEGRGPWPSLVVLVKLLGAHGWDPGLVGQMGCSGGRYGDMDHARVVAVCS